MSYNTHTPTGVPAKNNWVTPTVSYPDSTKYDRILAINDELIASLKMVDGKPQYTYTPPAGFTRIITLISIPGDTPRFEINTRYPPHLDPHHLRYCYSMIGLIQELASINDHYEYGRMYD